MNNVLTSALFRSRWFIAIAATWSSICFADGSAESLVVHNDEATSEVILLTVDKKTLQATLKVWPENFKEARTLRNFKIAIGKEVGDKQVEGDNKTPEGIYFTQRVIDGSTLPARYGPRAIPINFPNPVDRYHRKTGHGIWLHGVENNSRVEEANVTEGCVAFYNEEIKQLAYWLRPHQGIVLIAEDISLANRESDLTNVMTATQDWADAWATRDIDRYISHYHPDFNLRKQNLQAYRTYKQNVFRSYQSMKLEIDDIRVLTHPHYAVSIMNQDFNGDNRFVSSGRKILYWQFDQESGRWLILREIFENRRLELFEYTPEQLAMLAKPLKLPAESPQR